MAIIMRSTPTTKITSSKALQSLIAATTSLRRLPITIRSIIRQHYRRTCTTCQRLCYLLSCCSSKECLHEVDLRALNLHPKAVADYFTTRLLERDGRFGLLDLTNLVCRETISKEKGFAKWGATMIPIGAMALIQRGLT